MKRIAHAWLFSGLMLLPASALAAPCAGFTDLDDTGPFCADVAWLRNRGITFGCTSSTLFCPSALANRLQMAAFMSRLGVALTPETLFVDDNPGPLNIQASANNHVCQTPAYSAPVWSPYTVGVSYRKAVIHGLVWGIVDAAVVWSADVWFSTDGGLTWNPLSNRTPFNAATAAGATQGSTFARMNDLRPGDTYLFAIHVGESLSGPNGIGNFTDLACRLMVQIGNGDDVPWDY